MTLPPTDKTDKTDKTPPESRAARRQLEYAKAMRIALEAIREVKDLRPTPEAELLDQHRAGEVLFPGDWKRIEAALSPQKRDRGRPVGSGAVHERRIVEYATYRTFKCRLPVYRNPASSHRMTKSDVIAEAMRECGFRRLITYEAVAAEMRRLLPVLRQHFANMAALVAALPDVAEGGALKKLDDKS